MADVRIAPSGPVVSVSQVRAYQLPLITAPGPIPAAGLRWNGTFKAGYTYLVSASLGVNCNVPGTDFSENFFLTLEDNTVQPPCCISLVADVRSSVGGSLPQQAMLTGMVVPVRNCSYMSCIQGARDSHWTLIIEAPYFNALSVVEFAP